MELAVAHGYLSATVKGYAEKRQRERERQHRPATRTGKADVSGWEKLAALWHGPLQRGGERMVAEVVA